MTPNEVPSGPVVVDTDVFSFLLTQRDRYVEFAALVEGHGLTVSFATVGELRAGAIKARWGAKRRTDLESQIGRFVVLPATDRVTRMYAPLHARFIGQLPPNGANDLWTAACALAQTPGLTVVTNNLKDFMPLRDEFGLQLAHPDL